jgi:hypothetical protein
MKREDWIVTKNSTRPAGLPDRCFYCDTQIGKQHKSDCVIRCKTVVVDFTVRTVLSVPEKWGGEHTTKCYSLGSWCADNLLTELIDRADNTGRCLCNITTAKYIRDATAQDEKEYGATFIEKEES